MSFLTSELDSGEHWRSLGGVGGWSPPESEIKKKTEFINRIISKVLSDVLFNINQVPKSADI